MNPTSPGVQSTFVYRFYACLRTDDFFFSGLWTVFCAPFCNFLTFPSQPTEINNQSLSAHDFSPFFLFSLFWANLSSHRGGGDVLPFSSPPFTLPFPSSASCAGTGRWRIIFPSRSFPLQYFSTRAPPFSFLQRDLFSIDSMAFLFLDPFGRGGYWSSTSGFWFFGVSFLAFFSDSLKEEQPHEV